AAALKRSDMIHADDGAVVLIVRNHPSYEAAAIRRWCGEAPDVPERIAAARAVRSAGKPLSGGLGALEQILAAAANAL
ncbi:MAG TPA: threonine synthase, partial [Candidatus Treponema faecavium]|nr:threonine synthase [Candidatus Treponema faecavium]